ncbi:MAG: hypothetical protein WGN25_19800 [Candidatus Electrothrix sp. GW3-4]
MIKKRFVWDDSAKIHFRVNIATGTVVGDNAYIGSVAIFLG